MTDRNLQARVTAQLAWEPKVDSADIAVSVEGALRALVWQAFMLGSLIPRQCGGSGR